MAIQPAESRRAAAPQTREPFLVFLRSRERRIDLAVWLGLSIVLYLVLRLSYPSPFCATDSGTYLTAAQEHAFSPYRPPGYAAFLVLLHALSPRLRFIGAAQFALHAFSVLFLYLTALHACRPRSARFFRVAFVLALGLPSLLFCTNYLMSDSLFVSLTLLWAATLIWCLAAGNWPWMAAAVLASGLAAGVRYAGLVYPLVAAAVLALLLSGWKRRMMAVALHLALLLAICAATRETFREQIGMAAFSPFGGWARANNACAVIPAIRHDPRRPADRNMADLHEAHLLLPDSYYSLDSVLATASMWSENYPGKKCCFAIMRDCHTHYIQAWVEMGRRLGQYGNWLIRTYPLLFIEKFILPNAAQAVRSFDCPGGRDLRLSPVLLQWLKERRAGWSYQPGLLERLWGAEKILKYVLWVLSLAALPYLLVRERRRLLHAFPGRLVVLIGVYGTLFILFSIVSHPINCFRYLLPVHVFQLLLAAVAGTEIWERMSRS